MITKDLYGVYLYNYFIFLPEVTDVRLVLVGIVRLGLLSGDRSENESLISLSELYVEPSECILDKRYKVCFEKVPENRIAFAKLSVRSCKSLNFQ